MRVVDERWGMGWVVAAVAALGLCPLAEADVITPANDGQVNTNGDITDPNVHFVGRGGNGIVASAVYAFLLPVLPAGATISDATFTVVFEAGQGVGFNVDLYGLGFRSSPTLLTTDAYGGALDTTDATRIQDNFGFPGMPTGAISTSAEAGQSLADYLNAQYAAGAVGGQDYVFLRLSPDTTNTSLGRFNVDAMNDTGDGVPSLSYTVPEPASFAWVAIGFVSIGCRRGRWP